MTVRTYWRQQFNYRRGAFLHEAAGAERGRPAAKVEWGLHLRVALYPFTQGRSFARAAGLVGVSQAAVLAGYLWERRRTRKGRGRALELPPP